VKLMLETGSAGSIVNWSSLGGMNASIFTSVYSAAKAGVIAFTKAAAVEYGAQGIRANCLCPGFFPAEQNRKILEKSRVESILRHTPMGRLGDAPELIGAALLLLSPVAGSFITGEAIYVDGGFTAMTI